VPQRAGVPGERRDALSGPFTAGAGKIRLSYDASPSRYRSRKSETTRRVVMLRVFCPKEWFAAASSTYCRGVEAGSASYIGLPKVDAVATWSRWPVMISVGLVRPG
jgi:hypothetical protein